MEYNYAPATTPANSPLLGGSAAVPTVQNPGAVPPASRDPLSDKFAICYAALRQLARLLMMEDERRGNEIDAMANKLNRIKLDRDAKVREAMETMQGHMLLSQM